MISDSGSYFSILQSAFGCDSIIQLNLEVLPNRSTMETYTICDNESVEINGVDYDYEVTFTETFTAQNGCDSSVTYEIRVTDNIQLVAMDTAICEGDEVQLQVFGAENRTVSWTPAEGLSCVDCDDPIANPSVTTTYTVTAEGCNGSIVTTEVTVTVVPLPGLEVPEDQTIKRGETITISATTSNPNSKIDWYNGGELICSNCPTITQSPQTTTEYTVTATNSLGCPEEDQIVIFVEDPCELEKIEIANAITPNDDGYNDLFEIRNTGLSEVILVQIFNRWGEMVFETTDPTVQWDATFRGTEVNPGVYVYLVTVQCFDGQEVSLDGNVTVIKQKSCV